MEKITFDKQREVFNTLGSKQFDSSEPFKAEFLNGGEPIDLSQYNIRFECKKPDGNIVVDDESIIIKNVCEIEMYLNEQVTVVNGKVDCQFVLVNKINEKQTSTFTFYMDVQQSVLGVNGYSYSLITIAERLNKNIIEADKLHKSLGTDIVNANNTKQELVAKVSEANTAISTLTQKTNTGNETVGQLIDKTDIAKQEKINLEATVTDAIEKDGILTRTTILADTTNTILQQSVDQVQDNINTINATANSSKIILPEHWVGVEPNLTYTWNHRLNTKNVSVDVFDEETNETLFWSVGRPDENNMIIRSKTRRHLRVVLGAKYYSGGDLNSNEEIIEARKGEVSLRTKVDKIDSALTKNANDIILANSSLEHIGLKVDTKLDETFFLKGGWTPAIYTTDVSTGFIYNFANGRYFVNDTHVTCIFEMEVSFIPAQATGGILLKGLPFAVNSSLIVSNISLYEGMNADIGSVGLCLRQHVSSGTVLWLGRQGVSSTSIGLIPAHITLPFKIVGEYTHEIAR